MREKGPSILLTAWDGMPDLGDWEEGRFKHKELKDHMFNQDREGAWGLDVDLSPVDKDNISDNDGDHINSDSTNNDSGSDSNNTNGCTISLSSDSDLSDSDESEDDE